MKRYSESLEQWEQEAYHDGYGADWLADIGEGVKYYAMECEAKGRRPTFAGLIRYIIPDVLNKYEVLLSTVGQYTGLDDSAGRKVFEGDVLKFTDKPNDYEWTGRIEFGNPNCGYTWGFQIVHLSGLKPNIDTLCWFDMEEGGAYSEVIGTVFDEVTP